MQITKDFKDVFASNNIKYSIEVNNDRSLPDLRDGLKPIGRRIIYTMYDGGYTASKPHKKSARIIGDLIGKYHPHGDTSAYKSLVLMAQPFGNSITLLDGHGNFGSINNNDEYAAMRYTEIRLAKHTEDLMLDGLKYNAVDIVPNYDHSETEPEVLPAKLPMILINGNIGVGANGWANEIPNHNVLEVCKAVKLLIANPKISDTDLYRHIAPDFNTGGIILDHKEIMAIYKNGRGTAKIRVNIAHEGTNKLIITGVMNTKNLENLTENIIDKTNLRSKEAPITNIKDISNESSDKNGIRIVITLKEGSDRTLTENLLYKHTNCQTNMKVILSATNGDKFGVYSLRDLLSEWLNFRLSTLDRIYKYNIRRMMERIHIIKGLLLIEDHIDNIIKTIKSSSNKAEAMTNLQASYTISELQAKYIVETQLYKLSRLDSTKLHTELEELTDNVKHHVDIINDKSKLLDLINSDMDYYIDIFKSYTRKTKILNGVEDLATEDTIPNDRYFVVVTDNNHIKKVNLDLKLSNTNTKGISIGKLKDGSTIINSFYANNRDTLLVFTNKGYVYSIKLYDIEVSTLAHTAKSLKSYINFKPDEVVTNVLAVSTDTFYDANSVLVAVTTNGKVKATKLSEYNNITKAGLIAIKLAANDTILGVKVFDRSNDIFMATELGYGSRYSLKDIPVVGRNSTGVKAMDLRSNDNIVSFDSINKEESDDGYIFVISAKGMGKLVKITQPNSAGDNEGYNTMKRGLKGTILAKTKLGDKIVKSLVVKATDNIFINTNKKLLALSVKNLPVFLRPTIGNKIINVDDANVINAERINE